MLQRLSLMAKWGATKLFLLEEMHHGSGRALDYFDRYDPILGSNTMNKMVYANCIHCVTTMMENA